MLAFAEEKSSKYIFIMHCKQIYIHSRNKLKLWTYIRGYSILKSDIFHSILNELLCIKYILKYLLLGVTLYIGCNKQYYCLISVRVIFVPMYWYIKYWIRVFNKFRPNLFVQYLQSMTDRIYQTHHQVIWECL